MNKTPADSYDVEVINGFHIPISMEPGPYVAANNYSCGTPDELLNRDDRLFIFAL